MDKAKISFSDELVRLEIVGCEKPRPNPEDANPWNRMPMMREDHGICAALHRWEQEIGLRPEYLAMSGGGRYVAYYTATDAARVRAWLELNYSDRAAIA